MSCNDYQSKKLNAMNLANISEIQTLEQLNIAEETSESAAEKAT